jgi:hypothetical protein
VAKGEALAAMVAVRAERAVRRLQASLVARAMGRDVRRPEEVIRTGGGEP